MLPRSNPNPWNDTHALTVEVNELKFTSLHGVEFRITDAKLVSDSHMAVPHRTALKEARHAQNHEFLLANRARHVQLARSRVVEKWPEGVGVVHDGPSTLRGNLAPSFWAASACHGSVIKHSTEGISVIPQSKEV